MSIKIAAYQMEIILGDMEKNFENIKNFYYQNSHCDLIVYPEFSICGYGVGDNLYNKSFQDNILYYIEKIKDLTKNSHSNILIGTPYFTDNKIYNCALYIKNGEIDGIFHKVKFPNYGVFNERRYFDTKESNDYIIINDVKIGIFICEDLWHMDYVNLMHNRSVDFCISINASVFESNKHLTRLQIVKNAIDILHVPILYLNSVGANDEVIFDGSSFVMGKNHGIVGILNHCRDDFFQLNVEKNGEISSLKDVKCSYESNENVLNYQAIMFGLQNFIGINGFRGVIIGLSGGIDSVLTTTMAVDALGSDNVIAVSMPSKWTLDISKEIINELVENLNIRLIQYPIDDLYDSYASSVKNIDFSIKGVGENLQARIRGNILMMMSNYYDGFMVLSTSNKSECATGYSTLYGDSCGGFNLLKDLYKTQIFSIANFRNQNIPKGSLLNKLDVIPQRAITRKPSAELRDNQFDEDNLLKYDILDGILYDIIEKNLSYDALCVKFQKKDVNFVINLLNRSQYKRLQSPVGVKLSTRSLNIKEFQYPLAIYNKKY